MRSVYSITQNTVNTFLSYTATYCTIDFFFSMIPVETSKGLAIMDKIGKTSRTTFHTRLNEMVKQLRDQIRGGDYRPGDYLPSETSLVKQYKLSNKSVRKGLEQLIRDGLVVKINRIGSQVTELAADTGTMVTLIFGCHSSIERDIHLSVLLDDFHNLHPSIRVRTVRLVSGDYRGTAREYLQNESLDLFTINNMDFMFSVDNDSTQLLEPLDPDPGCYGFANDVFLSGEKLLARPIVFSPILLAYNRDHFREAGVPEPDGSWTWDEALRHAAALTVPGKRHGLYFHLMSDNRWPAFLLQSGMRFEPDESGVVQLKGTRMMASIRLCKQIVTDSSLFPTYMSENNDDVNELFMQGKVSMIMTNYMTLNEIKHSDIDYDISPLPYLFEPRSLLNVIGVAVNKASLVKEAAKLLADYLASPRAQQIIRQRTLSLPARKQVAEAPIDPTVDAMNRPSRYFLFREIMFSYRLHRELNLPIRALPQFRQLLKKYWADLITEEELYEQAGVLWMEDKGL